jgi:hypothetical protein
MQIFGETESDPIITIDAVNDEAAFVDEVRTCPSTGCSTTPLSNFEGSTVVVDIYVKYGENGTFVGTVKNLDTGITEFVSVRFLC